MINRGRDGTVVNAGAVSEGCSRECQWFVGCRSVLAKRQNRWAFYYVMYSHSWRPSTSENNFLSRNLAEPVADARLCCVGPCGTRRARRRGAPSPFIRMWAPAHETRAHGATHKGGRETHHHPTSLHAGVYVRAQHAAAGAGGPPRATELASSEQARRVRSGPSRELRGTAPEGGEGERRHFTPDQRH